MEKTRLALLALAATLALSFAAEAVSPVQAITGKAKLEALVSGKTQYGHRSDGTDDVEYHKENGVSAYWYWGCLYRGRWWATEENICYFYPAMDVPGPHCFSVTEEAGELLFYGTGDPSGSPTVRIYQSLDGNVEAFPLNTDLVCDEVS